MRKFFKQHFDVQGFKVVRTGSFGDAAAVAMVAIQNFGIDKIENAPRSRLPVIRDEIMIKVTARLREAAQKPLHELCRTGAEITHF